MQTAKIVSQGGGVGCIQYMGGSTLQVCGMAVVKHIQILMIACMQFSTYFSCLAVLWLLCGVCHQTPVRNLLN